MVSDLHDQALAFICRTIPVVPKDLSHLNSGRKVKRACPVLFPTLQGASPYVLVVPCSGRQSNSAREHQMAGSKLALAEMSIHESRGAF